MCWYGFLALGSVCVCVCAYSHRHICYVYSTCEVLLYVNMKYEDWLMVKSFNWQHRRVLFSPVKWRETLRFVVGQSNWIEYSVSFGSFYWRIQTEYRFFTPSFQADIVFCIVAAAAAGAVTIKIEANKKYIYTVLFLPFKPCIQLSSIFHYVLKRYPNFKILKSPHFLYQWNVKAAFCWLILKLRLVAYVSSLTYILGVY